jgi:hypothetical protein
MVTTTDTVPRPIEVGREMDALRRFCPPTVVWEGTIHAGGMGPGTPAMRGIGRGTHVDLQDGRWIAGDYEQDQFLEDGTFVLRWQLHWVSGWSPDTGEYRASMVDSYGHAAVYRGRIEGNRLVFEPADPGGPPIRLTWDAGEPGLIRWRNEIGMPDGTWFLIEEYPMTVG